MGESFTRKFTPKGCLGAVALYVPSNGFKAGCNSGLEISQRPGPGPGHYSPLPQDVIGLYSFVPEQGPRGRPAIWGHGVNRDSR